MREKKIIILPNDIKSPFFINEIPYIKKNFSQIKIIGFGKQIDKDIINKYDLDETFVSLSDLRPRHIIFLLEWLRQAHVKKEIQENVSFTKLGIKKLGYIIYYGIFRVLTFPFIEGEIKEAKEGSDIYLYSYWLSRPAYCICGFKEKYKNYNIKCFSRAHGYDLYESRNSMNYLPFKKFISQQLDYIYFISKDGYNYFKEKHGRLDDNKLKISYLGTYNEYDYIKKTVKKNEIVIASCSSIIPIKRLDLIIETISYLQGKGLPITWLHIGTGELIEIIQQEAKQKLKEQSFLFLGQIDNDDILQTYMRYDVDYFINLSDSEGIPVSIMEAISVGIPAIARNVGGNSEIVDSQSGYLINHNEITRDFSDIYSFIQERIYNLELYKRKSLMSVKRWRNFFSANQNYTQFFKNVTGE